MDPQSLYARQQYSFVKDSRSLLFDYCDTISPAILLNENSSFGRGGSIRNLLVHIANTYEFWIANTALQHNRKYAEYSSYTDMTQIRELFDSVNDFMDEFVSQMDSSNTVEYQIANGTQTATPLKLFSHVITHEYHHKGQILSLSRHLGYIPVDTDIMR